MFREKLKREEIFESGNFDLYQGDCIDLMRSMPAESVDMIFADPPYNLSNGGYTVSAGKRVSVHKGDWDKSEGVEEDFEFHRKWIEAANWVLKPNGTIWISGTYHSIYQCGFALQLAGWHILNEISWFKPNAAPNVSCRVFTASHETIIWARKSKKSRQTFNYGAMKNGHFPEDKLKKAETQMRSVWSIATPPKSEKRCGKHPAQKPLKLLDRIILSSTNENDIILDPFSGSGTTGISAVSLGRRYIGIEQEKEYFDLSIQRFNSLMEQKDLNFQKGINMSEIITRAKAMQNLQKHIGVDLINFAEKYGITVFNGVNKNGKPKQNKGWKGLVLERLAGLENGREQAPNGLGFELKSVSCVVNRKGDVKINEKETLKPKETMAITMIGPWLKDTSFLKSHVWDKLKSLVFCAVQWDEKHAEGAILKSVSSMDLTKDKALIDQLTADYELIQKKYIDGGLDNLTGRDGVLIQARTKGAGGDSKKTRAFYARKILVQKIIDEGVSK